jgi:hypothetical protein
MALKPIDKTFTGNKKDVRYLNRDFASFKQALTDFAKTYFPNTANDFSDASPGTMFIELASYVGDVLSFYTDAQLKESFINLASNKTNLITHAQNLGYKPKISTPAIVNLSLYQILPAIKNDGLIGTPDFRYALRIEAGMEAETTDGIVFRTMDVCDFNDETDRDITLYNKDTGEFLIKKRVKAISADELEMEIDWSTKEFEENPSFIITDDQFLGITSIHDDENNRYYEVDFLAQDFVYIEEPNISINGNKSSEATTTPYLLKQLKTNRRFVTRVLNENTIEVRFGSGNEDLPDEILVPNTKNVGLGLNNSIQRLNQGYDPSNFLFTNAYGIAPQKTKLKIKYLSGGGLGSNIASDSITKIRSITFNEDANTFSSTEQNTYAYYRQQLQVTNDEPAVGGAGFESLELIRENSIANFASQNRAVTKQDYEIRVLSLPPKFGNIAKVYVEADGNIDDFGARAILKDETIQKEFLSFVKSSKSLNDKEIEVELKKFLKNKKDTPNPEINNPFAINMYLLAYDINKNLIPINESLKQNLKIYLNEHRMLTDAVNILKAFIINIGVNFEVTVFNNYNKREVVLNCIQTITNFFDIDKWKINQPINLSELELEIANVEGVSSVPLVEIYNICKSSSNGGDYATNSYNIKEATKNKIIYPSLDPSIFELKFPNVDIKGRAL